MRRTGAPVPWAAIVRLYDTLLEITGSPVTAINRAVALVELEGPQAALVALDALEHNARLRDYQPTGRQGPNCSRAAVHENAPAKRTSAQSAWSAILPYVASSSGEPPPQLVDVAAHGHKQSNTTDRFALFPPHQ